MIFLRVLQYAIVILAASAISTAATSAESIQLRPYKDRLFAYPGVIESQDDVAFLSRSAYTDADVFEIGI